jgi:hypothetical protein
MRERIRRASSAALLCGLAAIPSTLAAQRASDSTHAAAPAHRRTLADLGFPNGLSLDGLNSERTISFRLPARAALDSAVIQLFVHFSRSALPESNLQLFVNSVRIGVAQRSAADSSGTLALRVAVPRSLLTGDFLSLSLRSSIGTMRDRCLDQRLSLSYLEIDRSSSFTYYAPLGGIGTIRQAWAIFPDTITLALPNRRLTAEEFRAAYTVGIAAANVGRWLRYARFPALGDLAFGTPADFAAAPDVTAQPTANANISVFRFGPAEQPRVGIALDAQRGATGAALLEPHWLPLSTSPALKVDAAAPKLEVVSNDPTFADLGITDLARDVGGEAVWRIPLDLRSMPAGRVPSRVELRLVTAPNTNDRQIVFFAFLNGTLVRSADVTESGAQQLIQIRLPSSLLVTRNELRLVIQRHLPASDACTQLDYPIPAQFLPSSRVYTTKVDRGARAFTAVTSQLASEDPLYLPERALDAPADYLPLLVPLGRAFWFGERAPKPTFYGAAAPTPPNGPFMLIGRPAGATIEAAMTSDSGRFTIRRKNSTAPMLDIADLRQWSVAQVVSWNSHVGVQVLPSTVRSRLPDYPDAYGANSLVLADADSTVFQLNPSGRDAGLLFNDGPTILERIRGDWILWSVFLLLVVGPPLVLAARAVWRRTPRRQLRRGFNRTPGDSQS